MPKISGYVKVFKVKGVNNKIMSSRIGDEKLLEKYEAIWTKIEDFKNIELSDLPIYDDRYIKTKIRTYNDQIYINFRGLNVLEHMTWNVNLLQSFLLILCLYTTRNTICKYF